MKDKFGLDLHIGDIVTFPRYGTLHYGIILNEVISENPYTYVNILDNNFSCVGESLSNICKVQNMFDSEKKFIIEILNHINAYGLPKLKLSELQIGSIYINKQYRAWLYLGHNNVISNIDDDFKNYKFHTFMPYYIIYKEQDINRIYNACSYSKISSVKTKALYKCVGHITTQEMDNLCQSQKITLKNTI